MRQSKPRNKRAGSCVNPAEGGSVRGRGRGMIAESRSLRSRRIVRLAAV